MKNFTHFLLYFTLLCALSAQAQKKDARLQVRCGTMEALEKRLQQDPAFRAQWEQKQASINAGTQRGSSTAKVSTLTGPVTIPVIVHVVLPNPYMITEAQVDYLLNQLNLCYSGLNADSTNGVPFYSVRGHSLIRFTRARRTPTGQLTNGVERRVGSVQVTTTTYQAVKHSAQGGLDPWDITQYYNLWVGDAGASGLLGIAPTIGVGAATETNTSNVGIDGICVDYRGFSNGCFSYPAFAQAKTVVHEIGHNFGLYHTFSGCAAGADFGQPAPAGQTLPASMVGAAADDTPGLSTSTSGCPNGSVASNCAGVPNPPGKMYQNYMDYTDDPCYSMFTKTQVARMEYILENYRPGYLTTQGAVPPAGSPALDVSPTSVVSPGGSEFNSTTCATTNYPTPACAGPFIPKVLVTNNGTTTLTSVTVSVSVNGGAPVSTTATGLNVLTGYTTVVTLPSQNLIGGSNTIVFTTSAPNGGVDQLPTNDVLTTTIVISGSGTLPIVEGFEGPAFPPAPPPVPWTINNPDGDFTWQSHPNGHNSANALFIDNYDVQGLNHIDDFVTSSLAVNPSDSLYIDFDLAYKNYPAGAGVTYDDTLSVLVSTSCGGSYTTVYKKQGAILATAGSSTTGYTNPAATDWRTEHIALGGAMLSGGQIRVAFRNTSQYGNNIFIDNINIKRISNTGRDLQLVSLDNPSLIACSPSLTPSVTVKNMGPETVTGFSVAYTINSGAPVTTTITGLSLAVGSSMSVPLTGTTIGSGNFNIKVYTFQPVSTNGSGDANTANDTLAKLIYYTGQVSAPLNENFTASSATSFPPASWTIINYDSSITWKYSPVGNTNPGSAFLNSYIYTGSTMVDDLITPVVNYTTADSVILSFDVASKSKYYPGTTGYGIDTLEVLATSNCGNTFQSVYKKWGQELSVPDNTNQGPNTGQDSAFLPDQLTKWRNIRLDLSQFLSNPSVQFVFRATTNNGNNIYLDNINVKAKTLPDQLKQNGYLILPNPFSSSFSIWHYQTPSTLRYVNVYDAIGRLVWAKAYAKNADKVIIVDLQGRPAGTYIVSLGYEDEYRNVTEKVIKK